MDETPRALREPKCVCCRNHGIEINVKRHKWNCPFQECSCRLCQFVKQRKIKIAERIATRKAQQFNKKKNECVETVLYWNIDISEGSLSKDFSNLLDTEKNCDVEIKCGEHSIRAHQIILGARSEVFRMMFQTDMLESRTGVVEIRDVDISHLRIFIRFLYTDELPDLTLDKAMVLYEHAEKYAVKSLKQRCAQYFEDNLSIENIYQCFDLANAYSDHKLEEGVVTYIVDKDLWNLPFKNYPRANKEIGRLLCENMVTRKEKKYVQTEPYWIVDESEGSLSKDLLNLLKSNVNHDVEIQCEEGSIKAHKIVLCARSDVFKTLLRSDMFEGRTQVIEHRDIAVGHMQNFIRYLYTDALPELTFNNVKQLHDIGKKYNVRNLVRRCYLGFQDFLTPKLCTSSSVILSD